VDISTPQISFEDDRGIIKDIIAHEPVDGITVIGSKKGVVRGNHYHKDTIQWVYLLSGKMQSLTRMEGEDVIVGIIDVGGLLKTVPMEEHALVALEDSEFLVFTRGPRSGEAYESDTFRLETPLKAPE
jgi:hypothetical protein